MEFHQIRYFLAACDHMNFTRAAEACAVSQPALTVAVRKLEEELGGALFLREPSGLKLTALGRQMRTHLALVEEMREAARRAAAEMQGVQDRQVGLGVFSTIGPSVLAPAIAAFRAARPDLRLILHDVWGQRAFDLLRSGAFDCALVARPKRPLPTVAIRPLYREPMVAAFAADHPLAQGPATARAFHGQPYVDRLRCEFREEIQAELASRGIELSAVLSAEAEDWAQSLVAGGEAFTILPRDQVIGPGIATVAVEDLFYERVIGIATVRDRSIPEPARDLVEFLSTYDWAGASQ